MSAVNLVIIKYSKDSLHEVFLVTYESPLGSVIAAADEEYLYAVIFEDSKNFEKCLETLSQELQCKFIENENKLLQKFKLELDAYFDGKIKKFSIPVKTFGSKFQKEVWDELQQLPYGSTQSYGDLAKAMGRPSSHARAIGAACGANAHLIVIPCHRLVSSNSKGGYNSCVDRKEKLLAHEKKFAT